MIKNEELSIIIGPDEPKPVDKTMVDLLKFAYDSFGDKPMVKVYRHGKCESLTYNEVKIRTDIFAKQLIDHGYSKGDIVGVFTENRIETCLWIYTLIGSGFVFFPIDFHYTSPQLKGTVEHVKPKLLVTEYSKLNLVREALPEIKCFVYDLPEELCDDNTYSLSSFSVMKTSDDILKSKLEEIKNSVLLMDTVVVANTGGSTGFPKACEWSHFGLANATGLSQDFIFTDGEFVSAPLFSTLGILRSFYPIRNGGYSVYSTSFDVGLIYEIIEIEKVSKLAISPSVLLAVITFPDRPKYDISSVKTVISAGAIATPDLLERAVKHFNAKIARSAYSMTEVVSRIFTMANESCRPTLPIPWTTVKIVDDEGKTVTRGVSGEIYVKSPFMMKGYKGIPREETFTKDGFFPTGDIGEMDENMEMRVTGRKKDLIIRGGSNIWPAEIENVLNKHPKIQQSAVVGHPDRSLGEIIVAYIIPKIDVTCPSDRELKEFLNSRIPNIAIPKYIFFIDKFPLTSFGKIKKQILKTYTDDYIKRKWEEIEVPEDKKPKSELSLAIAELWSNGLKIPLHSISIDLNFNEVGGDSILGSQTTYLIKKYYPEAPNDIISRVSTISEIENFLSQKESSEMYDKHDLMLSEAIQAPKIPITYPPKTALLTGASGYLGVHLLHELVNWTSIEKIYVIIREVSISDARKKLSDAIHNHHINFDLKKIEILLGDISRPKLGVSNEDYQILKNNLDIIFFNAAVVNWTISYNKLAPSNVFSVKDILELISQSPKNIPLHFTSTIAVGIGTGGKEEYPNTENTPQVFPYIVTKWVAEKILKQATERGFLISVYRPGFIVGSSETGVINVDDFVWRFIKLCVQDKICPKINGLLSFTPVNKLAKTMISLAQTNNFKIYNLLPEKFTTYYEILNIIRNKGIELHEIESTEIGKYFQDSDIGQSILLIIQQTNNSETTYEAKNFTIRNELDASTEDLEKMVDYMISIDFFDDVKFAKKKSISRTKAV